MRNIALIFALSLTLFYSCEKPNPNLTDTSPLTKDSTLIAEVDNMVEEIYTTLRAGVNPVETSMNFKEEEINMSYYDLEDGYARWDAKLSPDGFEHYPTFFLKDGEPIYFRFREWNMQSNIGAGEVLVYLKDGKIFYAKERSMPLAQGQSPVALREKGHVDSKRTRKDLWELMNTYYPSMKEAWDKRNEK